MRDPELGLAPYALHAVLLSEAFRLQANATCKICSQTGSGSRRTAPHLHKAHDAIVKQWGVGQATAERDIAAAKQSSQATGFKMKNLACLGVPLPKPMRSTMLQ